MNIYYMIIIISASCTPCCALTPRRTLSCSTHSCKGAARPEQGGAQATARVGAVSTRRETDSVSSAEAPAPQQCCSAPAASTQARRLLEQIPDDTRAVLASSRTAVLPVVVRNRRRGGVCGRPAASMQYLAEPTAMRRGVVGVQRRPVRQRPHHEVVWDCREFSASAAVYIQRRSHPSHRSIIG